MEEALSGIKVLDFAMGVAGPHAGLLCAQHGADVVKIESPEGDWSRMLGRQYGDLSAYATVFNRGKRSLAIDLKLPQARDLIFKMAVEADVIIEAFRPNVMKKFGLDYASVRERNPDVIYMSVSGFGQSGPRSTTPANDSVAQAYSGFMAMNKDSEGRPQRLDMIVMDIITGLYGYQGISTALISKFRGRRGGRYIDCSLMQAATAFQAAKIIEYQLEGGVQAMYVPLGVFATSDGFVSVSTMRDHHYEALCHAMDRPDLAADPRFKTRIQRVELKSELLPQIVAGFAKHPTEEWQRRLTRHGVLHSPVKTYRDVLDDEQLKVLEAIAWVEQDGLAGRIPLPNIPGAPPASTARNKQSPHIGEHSIEILQERGVSPDQIERWIAEKIVRTS